MTANTLRVLNLIDATDDIILAIAGGLEELTLTGASQLVTGRSISACSSLRTFVASAWPHVSTRAIAAIAGVRKLILARCPVTDAMLAPLAGSSSLIELDVSSMWGMQHRRQLVQCITDAGLARVLAGTRIRTLNVSGRDKLTGSFLGALASLEDLDVRFCSMLAGAALLPLAGRLQRLECQYSGVSAADVSLVAAAAVAAAAGAAGRPPVAAG